MRLHGERQRRDHHRAHDQQHGHAPHQYETNPPQPARANHIGNVNRLVKRRRSSERSSRRSSERNSSGMTTVGSCTGIRSDSGAIADAIVIITGIIGISRGARHGTEQPHGRTQHRMRMHVGIRPAGEQTDGFTHQSRGRPKHGFLLRTHPCSHPPYESPCPL